MSKARPDLKNSKEEIKELVHKLLATQSQIIAVQVVGSRSPFSNHKPRTDSDWDLVAIVEPALAKAFRLPDYRLPYYSYHVDVTVRSKEVVDRRAVEIWPNDDFGVLT